jgi:hypothetical protein
MAVLIAELPITTVQHIPVRKEYTNFLNVPDVLKKSEFQRVMAKLKYAVLNVIQSSLDEAKKTL